MSKGPGQPSFQSYRPLLLLALAFVAGIFTRELSLPSTKGLPGYSHNESFSPSNSVVVDERSAQLLQVSPLSESPPENPSSAPEPPVSSLVTRQVSHPFSHPSRDQKNAPTGKDIEETQEHGIPIPEEDQNPHRFTETQRKDTIHKNRKVKNADGYSMSHDHDVGNNASRGGTDLEDYSDGEEQTAESGDEPEDGSEASGTPGEDGEGTAEEEWVLEDVTNTQRKRKKNAFSRAIGAVVSVGRQRTWATPFIRAQRVSVLDEPTCEGIIPKTFFNQLNRPIQKVSDLKHPGQRLLLFVPRFGLGNSLRGYVSAYVYALLSGRRLIRVHSGQHAKVYDLLCQGFHCNYDAILPDAETKDAAQVLWREVAKLRPFNIKPHKLKTRGIIDSLKFSYPLVLVNVGSFFDFWRLRKNIRECVYRALKCKSMWCVHSRAIYSLLGKGPRKDLQQAISQFVANKPYSPPSKNLTTAVRQQKIGVDVMFDVALHVRTRTEAVEKSHAHCEGDGECKQQFLEASETRVGKYLSPRLWGCIRKVIQKQRELKLGSKRDSGQFTIFLATDNEELRAAFADRLATMGTVYFSSGKVVHTSKVSGGLPTLAEWYLLAKADLVLEAESYVSTFAYFSGLLGNSTLASLSVKSSRRCSLKVAHKAKLE